MFFTPFIDDYKLFFQKVHFFCVNLKKIVGIRKIIVHYTIKHRKNVHNPTFHTFNLFMEGDFLRKEGTYE
nr:MAG TPA: hypothetical protein [Caudoviricetes sp.]